MASARKNHNAIWSLKDEDGLVVEKDQALKDLGVRHFHSIFKDDNLTTISAQLNVIKLYPSFFSPEAWSNFNSKVTLMEIERALKSFKKDKSPGRDGFPVDFFLAFFDLLGDELVLLVEEARMTRLVLPSLNSNFITLIPKKDNPSTFADFRPISLCNLIYKLIAKIAASSLKPLLDCFISAQ